MGREVDSEIFNNKFRRCIDLLESSFVQEAKELFLECLCFDIEYMDKLFILIFKVIFKKDYGKVFLYFDLVLASNEDRYIRDVKFYSYLINYIFRMPLRFKELIKDLTYEDVKLDEDDERYDLPGEINKVRKCALNGEGYILNEKEHEKLHSKINWLLWLSYNRKTKKFYYRINSSAEPINPQMIVDEIAREGAYRNLSEGMIQIKNLAEIIINIKRGIMPETSIEVVDNEVAAIEIGNFELAYQLRRSRKKAGGSLRNNDIILNLLKEIISLLNNQSKKDSNISFDDLFNMLIDGKKDGVIQSLEVLPGYLRSIDKSEYEFLIANLIKVCALEQEMGYQTSFFGPLCLLAQLKQQRRIEIDIKLYERYVWEAINNNEMEIAQKYIYIILGYIDIGGADTTLSIKELRKLRERLIRLLSLSSDCNTNQTFANSKCIKSQMDDYYYGIPCIKDIMRDIESTNLSIKKACQLLGIDYVTMNFIILIYAKNCYSCGFNEHGDKLLSAVENSANKSLSLIAALEDVRARRRFYANDSSIPKIDLSKFKLLNP